MTSVITVKVLFVSRFLGRWSVHVTSAIMDRLLRLWLLWSRLEREKGGYLRAGCRSSLNCFWWGRGAASVILTSSARVTTVIAGRGRRGFLGAVGGDRRSKATHDTSACVSSLITGTSVHGGGG